MIDCPRGKGVIPCLCKCDSPHVPPMYSYMYYPDMNTTKYECMCRECRDKCNCQEDGFEYVGDGSKKL